MTPATDKLAPKDLYRDLILDHAKSPRNFRVLESCTHHATGINPLCGDKLHVYVQVGTDTTLTDVSFEGSGCAISIASASLLTESLRQIPLDQANATIANLLARLNTGEMPTAKQPAVDFENLRALEGVREHPARIKCATLAWQTLQAALSNNDAPTTTE